MPVEYRARGWLTHRDQSQADRIAMAAGRFRHRGYQPIR